jgi:hypothetical protein
MKTTSASDDRVRLLAMIACLVVSLTSARVKPVVAQGNGASQTTIWNGVYNNESFRVGIIAQDSRSLHGDREGQAWWRWGNTETDMYLFIFGEGSDVDLILDFSVEAGRLMARLYIPSDQALRVKLPNEGGDMALPAQLKPRLIFWPRTGGWLVDGRANFDLEGQWLNREGHPEWQFQVGDAEPGVPAWTTSIRLEDTRPGDGYPRFSAALRADPTVGYEMVPPLMPTFPFLSVGEKEPHYGPEMPLHFDPNSNELSAEWVGFHTAGMYQINSLSYPPFTDFESPFAFYRFDPTAGLQPNMVIRSDIWPASSPFGHPVPETQSTAMRLTWTDELLGNWRYSISVIGNHVMDEQIMIGDHAIRAVAYDKLHEWITSKPWKAATFVEATNGEDGSEGIYDFSVEDAATIAQWVNGLLEQPPLDLSQPYLQYPTIHPQRLKEGFRGEYSLHYNQAPQLYFSGVDNRVHLSHAEEGIWNLGGGSVLRTYNLDGDANIDAWVRERVSQAERDADIWVAEPGEAVESLYRRANQLIYAGENTIEIGLLEQQPVRFDLVPPTDKDSWQAFLDKIASLEGQSRPPQDLSQWLDAWPSTRSRLWGAHLTAFRTTKNGYRFVLDLRPGFRVSGPDPLGVAGLDAGRYVVHYDGVFHVAPARPPMLTLDVQTAAGMGVGSDGPVPLRITVANHGSLDAQNLTLVGEARQISGSVQEVARRQVDAPAGPPQIVSLSWQLEPGAVNGLTFRLEDENGRLLAERSLQLMANDRPGAWLPLPESQAGVWLSLVFLLAFALALALGSVAVFKEGLKP